MTVLKRKTNRALLVQRANIDRYPPVINQLRMLEHLSEIRVLDRAGRNSREELTVAPNTYRIRVRVRTETDFALSLRERLVEAVAFNNALNREIARKPELAIAYDPDAAALILRRKAWPGLKRIVHFHEVLERESSGRTTRFAIRYLDKNLARADLVVVPDAERAKLVASEAQLRTAPTVVMNCPPRLAKIPESRLLPEMQKRGVCAAHIVHYQGAVGPDHHLEEIIGSMIHWPRDSIFVIVGGSDDEFRNGLRTLAQSVGVGARVQYIDRVPYDEVLSYAVGATLGVTLLEPRVPNWRYSAGASNKRFEYAALGVAQLTNSGPGIDEVFGRTGIASLVDEVTPDSVGREIGRLLSNEDVTHAMGKRARIAHLGENNYEAQFTPVLRTIESWMGNGQ